MYIKDLEGNEYPVQATSTNEGELNGNQSISLTIEANKANNLFIDNVDRMWEITDHDNVTHKIVYVKRQGVGNRLKVDIKGIPLFFDRLDIMRTYEEYNQSMTALVFFNLVFQDTGFSYVLVDANCAVDENAL